jgi:hypothetical protein
MRHVGDIWTEPERMRIAIVVVLILALAAVAWGAGELHRQSCINAHRVACSALPWKHGHVKHRTPNYFHHNPYSDGSF